MRLLIDSLVGLAIGFIVGRLIWLFIQWRSTRKANAWIAKYINDGATTPTNYDPAAQKEIVKHLTQTTHAFKFGRLLLIIFTVLVLLYSFALIFSPDQSHQEPVPNAHTWPTRR